MDPMSSKEDNPSMSLIEKAAARLDKLEAKENARAAARANASGASARKGTSTIERAAAVKGAPTAAVPPLASITPSAESKPRSRAATVPLATRANGLSPRAREARIKATANVRRGSAPVARPATVSDVPPPPQFEINFQMLESEGFLTPEEGRNQLAQEFRRIKRPLLLLSLIHI